MSNVKQEEELLDILHKVVEGKLRANRQKPVWDTLTPKQILARIKEEVNELEEQLNSPWHPSKIVMEAADVAAFCGMMMVVVTSPESN